MKPFFLRPPEDVTSAVSRRAELTCQVSGDPQPQIVWRRVGAELPLGRVHVTDGKSLRIDDLRLADEGEYVCRAENAVGSVTGSARLSVTGEHPVRVEGMALRHSGPGWRTGRAGHRLGTPLGHAGMRVRTVDAKQEM